MPTLLGTELVLLAAEIVIDNAMRAQESKPAESKRAAKRRRKAEAETKTAPVTQSAKQDSRAAATSDLPAVYVCDHCDLRVRRRGTKMPLCVCGRRPRPLSREDMLLMQKLGDARSERHYGDHRSVNEPSVGTPWLVMHPAPVRQRTVVRLGNHIRAAGRGKNERRRVKTIKIHAA